MPVELTSGVNAVSVLDLLCLVEQSWKSDPPSGPLALPAIQRDSVWRAKQVLEFWRSILAGLPIGMLYVQHQESGTSVRFRRDQDRRVTTYLAPLDHPHYDLLDGQQRIRALSLGLSDDPMKEDRTLWVVWTDNVWDLRLTSRMQPFGYEKDGGRLSVEDRRKARNRLEPDRLNDPLRFAGQLPAGKNGSTRVFDPDLYGNRVETKHGGPIPMPPLPAGFGAESACRLSDVVAAWRGKGTRPPCLPEAIWTELEKSKQRAKENTAVIMTVSRDVLEGHNLAAFFRRVGAGGTPITEEEQLFASFKAVRGSIRDIVHLVQHQVAAVFTPAQVMATVRRIANMDTRDSASWLPGFDATLKAISEAGKPNTNNPLAIQFNVLLPEAAQTSPVPHLFARAKDLLQGDGANLSDVILAKLSPELWQMLVYWCHRNAEPAQRHHRQEAARFAMYWMLNVSYPERCVRLCFPVIRDANTASFPGVVLYRELTAEGGQPRMFPPDDLKSFFESGADEDGMWRTNAERFQTSTEARQNSTEALAAAQWWYSKTALIWLQRNYLGRSFPGYLPLTEHEEDLPYDLDHILAYADYNKATFPLLDDRMDKHRRWAMGNTIGNFRLVESSMNRGDGNSDIPTKLPFLADPLNTEAGQAEDYLIGDEAEHWIALGPTQGQLNWNARRKIAFRTAVEKRAFSMYRKFYDDLAFFKWFNVGQ